MIVALDYDKTYTADPDLWDTFILKCIANGHSVICITMRFPSETIPEDLKSWESEGIKIYYTSRKAKLVWAKQNNIKVDIWIDDNPGWLFDDAASAA